MQLHTLPHVTKRFEYIFVIIERKENNHALDVFDCGKNPIRINNFKMWRLQDEVTWT